MRFGLCLVVVSALFAVVAAAPAKAQLPCGIIRPCPPPPPPHVPPPSPSFISLRVDPREVLPGETVHFSGRYGGSDDGEAVVQLVASRWPYGSEVVVATTSTVFGFFSFSHAPELNTRYEVRTVDRDPGPGVVIERSIPELVKVFAEVRRFKVKVVGRRAVKMRVKLDFPDAFAIPLKGRRIHWYIDRGGSATQIGKTTARVNDATKVVRGRVRARLPRGRYKFHGAFCLDLPVGIDLGVGDPSEGPCP